MNDTINKSEFKNSISKVLKTATPISGVFAVISDLCSPLGSISLYFLMAVSISFIVALFISLLTLRKKGITAFYNAKSTTVSAFCFAGVIIMSMTYLVTNKNPDTGFISANIDSVNVLQNEVFSKLNVISIKQDKILESQEKVVENIQDIKDVITGDDELKNMSNTEDLTVVKELNANSKHKDAKRLAIIYFENTSGEKKLNKLKKGLASMLISDLSNVYMLDILERDRLEDLIKEQKLSNSEGFDNNSASDIGKLLGAQIILTGAYFEMYGSFRIDARFIDVETGQILKSEGVDGQTSNFFKLEKQLVWKIIKNLDVKLSQEESAQISNSEKKQEISYELSLLFSEALNDIDNWDFERAIKKLNQILLTNPNFEPAKKELKKLEVNV